MQIAGESGRPVSLAGCRSEAAVDVVTAAAWNGRLGGAEPMAKRGSGTAAGAKGTRLSADVEPFVPKQQALGAKWYESSPATLPRYLTTCYPFVQDPYVDRLHAPENGSNNLSQNFSELRPSYPDMSSHLPADYSLCYAYKQSSDSSLNPYTQTPLHCDDICFSKHKYGSRGNKKKQPGQQDSTKEKSFLNNASKETKSRKELRNQGQNVNEAPKAETGEQLQRSDVFGDNATKGQDKQSNRCQHSKSKPLQKIQNESEPQTTVTSEVALSDFPILQSPATKQSSCDLKNARVSSKSSEQPAKIWRSDDTTDTDKRLGTTQLPGSPTASEKCSVPNSMTVTANTVASPASSSAATPSVLSWARVVSQAPKRPVPSSAPPKISTHDVSQSDDGETKLKEAAGKVKKKKKKKKSKEPKAAPEPNLSKITVQELPRFEDDEEFPDLASAISSSDKANSTGQDKFSSNKPVTKRLLKPSVDEELVFSVVSSHAIGGEQISLDIDQKPVQILRKESFQEHISSGSQKKAVEAPKKSGKKSKAPMQLDFGDMLAVLEQKQQEKKSKHTPKPVVLAVGGAFPMVSKETTASKRQPQSSSQEKVPHNPLDSSAPLVKRGKQREIPKAKKPTSLKKIILKEREERKQRRLLEEKGLIPSSCDIFAQELVLDQNESLLDTQNETAELNDSTEDLVNSAPSSLCQNLQPLSDTPKNPEGTETESVLVNPSRPKIHSRRFREYCSQVLSKEVDNYVTDLLKELVRFQDRLYQKDPIKAKKKRRIVMGLREVLKHLKLKKLKCVIISPNCERIQSKGGLDDALHAIIAVAREQEIPFVFALNRKALGRCVNKAVPVSVVGIFSYDGAENQFHQMVELTEEARNAYQEMLNALEQELMAGEGNSAGPLCELTEEHTVALDRVTSQSFSEAGEPEYVTTWKKLLKRQCNPDLSDTENTGTSETLHCDSEEESGDSIQKFPKSVLDFECQAAMR